MKEKILGIDLGTSNSCASVMIDGKPFVIPSPDSSLSSEGKTHPSVIHISEKGEISVGAQAKRNCALNPGSCIKFIKRRMGEDVKITLNNRKYSPEELSSFILKKLFKDAKDYLKEDIKKAVITVPAYFDDIQRQATKTAGEIAGIEVVRILNEPTAAALSYGLSNIKEEKKILVFDLGGGTLDITIMEGSEGVFNVLSTSGDTKLGGSDIDNLLKEVVLEDLKKQTSLDLSKEASALLRIKEACEKAKIELSSIVETQILLPFIAIKEGKPINYEKKINNSFLSSLLSNFLKKIQSPITDALNSASLKEQDIDEVILVGGPTKMKEIQKLLSTRFGETKLNKKIDPMVCVSMGAAIQGGILSGEVSGIVLVDVNPISLGVAVEGDLFEPIIDKNEKIPVSKTKSFTTSHFSQTEVDIDVYQGERKFVKDNRSLGKFKLTELKKARSYLEKPNITITFSIDVNGILNVHAKDVDTKSEREITIKTPSKFSKEELERMSEEAKKFEEEDELRKKKIIFTNSVDDFKYRVEDLKNTHKATLSEEKLKKLDSLVLEVEDLKTRIDSEDISVLEKTFSEKAMEMGKIMSEEISASRKQNAQEPNGPKDVSEEKKSTSEKQEEVISAADIN